MPTKMCLVGTLRFAHPTSKYKGKIVTIITSPETIKSKKALNAFIQLQLLLKKHPVGTLQEIKNWKNMGQNEPLATNSVIH